MKVIVIVHKVKSPEHVALQDSGPGSLRRPPQLTGKDWTPENSREIPWVPLEKFMQRHAKSTDCYIRETFHMVNCTLAQNIFFAAKHIFCDNRLHRT